MNVVKEVNYIQVTVKMVFKYIDEEMLRKKKTYCSIYQEDIKYASPG